MLELDKILPVTKVKKNLLDILNLFSDLLDFFLQFNGDTSNFSIGGLGADRIRFPIKLLKYKIKFLSNRAGLFQGRLELLDMASESNTLFGYIRLFDNIGNLFFQPNIINHLFIQ